MIDTSKCYRLWIAFPLGEAEARASSAEAPLTVAEQQILDNANRILLMKKLRLSIRFLPAVPQVPFIACLSDTAEEVEL